jgi:hypothetical protein
LYTVTTDDQAKDQVDALPADALAAYAEVRVVLETAPWSGRPINRDNPDGQVRVRQLGDHGMVVYLVLEDLRRVDILSVIWAVDHYGRACQAPLALVGANGVVGGYLPVRRMLRVLPVLSMNGLMKSLSGPQPLTPERS